MEILHIMKYYTSGSKYTSLVVAYFMQLKPQKPHVYKMKENKLNFDWIGRDIVTKKKTKKKTSRSGFCKVTLEYFTFRVSYYKKCSGT